LQQTPSAQNPEAQSAPVPQPRPLPFAPLQVPPEVQLPAGPHAPFTHSPDAHSAPLTHPLPLLPPPVQVPAVQPPPALHSADEAQEASHAPVPSQKPPPHSVSRSVPDATGEQAPALPAWLHAMQVPLHAVSQQTPSAQWRLSHAASDMQGAPSGWRGWHAPPMQRKPAAQSAVSSQLAGQVMASPVHSSPPQVGEGAAPAGATLQVPTAPSRLHRSHPAVQGPLQHTPSAQKPEAHSAPPLQEAPSTFFGPHVPAWQKLPALQSVSALHEARQVPVPLQVALPHSPAGSVRAGMGEQVPTNPDRLQAWQAPLQEPLQHTPSAHAPELHSVPAPQTSPFSFSAVQAPPAQREPALQSALEAQPDWHTPAPSQVFPPQAPSGSVPRPWLTQKPCVPATAQDWQPPLQEVVQQTPSTQKPDAHWDAAVQEAPAASCAMHAPPLQ